MPQQNEFLRNRSLCYVRAHSVREIYTSWSDEMMLTKPHRKPNPKTSMFSLILLMLLIRQQNHTFEIYQKQGMVGFSKAGPPISRSHTIGHHHISLCMYFRVKVLCRVKLINVYYPVLKMPS